MLVQAKVVDTFSSYVSAQTPKRLLMVSHESYTAINEYLISAVNGSTRSMASGQFQIGMTSPPPSCSKNQRMRHLGRLSAQAMVSSASAPTRLGRALCD